MQEELTGRVQNSTAHVTVYRYPYRMSLVRTSDSFKPGLKYTAYVSRGESDGGVMRATGSAIAVEESGLFDGSVVMNVSKRLLFIGAS